MSEDNPRTRWLLGPAPDLLFLANVTWPLFAFLLWFTHGSLRSDLELYLMTVVGTPHRWVTLGIVSNHKERLIHRWPTLLATGASATAVFGGLWFWTHDLGVMILARYLWNLWHVAAQHTGIARVYSIAGRPEKRSDGQAEKHLLRLFMLYAFLRVASLGAVLKSWDWLFHAVARWSISADRYDFFVLLIPLGLLARELQAPDRRLLSRYLYLTSVCSNYAAMILFCHYRLIAAALAVSAANAVFHATEYFGFVSWSVGRADQSARTWFLPALARRWTVTLLVFLYGMAFFSVFLAMKFTFFWIMANTWVSFLHYAYDGVIWKMPAVFPAKAPAPAPALS